MTSRWCHWVWLVLCLGGCAHTPVDPVVVMIHGNVMAPGRYEVHNPQRQTVEDLVDLSGWLALPGNGRAVWSGRYAKASVPGAEWGQATVSSLGAAPGWTNVLCIYRRGSWARDVSAPSSADSRR